MLVLKFQGFRNIRAREFCAVNIFIPEEYSSEQYTRYLVTIKYPPVQVQPPDYTEKSNRAIIINKNIDASACLFTNFSLISAWQHVQVRH